MGQPQQARPARTVEFRSLGGAGEGADADGFALVHQRRIGRAAGCHDELRQALAVPRADALALDIGVRRGFEADAHAVGELEFEHGHVIAHGELVGVVVADPDLRDQLGRKLAGVELADGNVNSVAILHMLG